MEINKGCRAILILPQISISSKVELIKKTHGNKKSVRLTHQKIWLPILHIFGQVDALLVLQCSEKINQLCIRLVLQHAEGKKRNGKKKKKKRKDLMLKC